MPKFKFIGKNYQTPDLVSKVTGRAKYAEDYRAEGMVFARVLGSPMPHCRVRSIDAREALALPGVVGILTADDLPPIEGPLVYPGRRPAIEAGLTNEPLYEGEPILLLAAVEETIAADAIEKIKLDLQPLPFVTDPLDSLRPGGPDARLDGNTMTGNELKVIKWTAEQFDAVDKGRLPIEMNLAVTDEWSLGNVDETLADADLVLDETIFFQSLSHQPLETRTAMAYWQNGKCYLHASLQSVAASHGAAARWVGVRPEEIVVISEYCGGGFGSKISGTPIERLAPLLSKKIGRPVMMRISRDEEHAVGRSRPGMQGRVRIGFRADGKVVAIDLFLVQDQGPYGHMSDYMSGGDMASLSYQPNTMRMRGIAVFTNTPPRAAQRGPGGVHIHTMLEPIMDKAAKKLGVDRLDMRRVNAPSGQAPYGRPRPSGRANASSAFVREAIDKGAAAFNWEERVKRSGQRQGTKLTGFGVAISSYSGGNSGFDGLIAIRPDGRLYIQSGVGNLGTESFVDTTRAAAEPIGIPWEKVEIVWGDTSKHLPWSCSQGGSSTTHAHTRANYAAGLDLAQKLREIAALKFGGSPDHYEIENERVIRKGQAAEFITFAEAAERAIGLGGRYDGHEVPEEVNGMTKRAAFALKGRGVMGVAKDEFPTGGRVLSYVIGFAEIEIDVETGEVRLIDYLGSADCGTILHPRSVAAQIHGGGIQGFGVALGQKWIYDKRWGLGVARRFYVNRPTTILDVPHDRELKWTAAEKPDPFSPVGAKGIGEPPQGAGSAAVVCAIADALGEGYFNRTPITRDMVLAKLESLPDVHGPLTPHV